MKMEKLFRTIVSKCIFIGFISIGLISCTQQSEPADCVFTNAKIYTVDNNQEWAEAVAIKGENIVYVGSNEGAKDFIGEETNVTDLKGKMILPGIISAHEHPITFMGLSSGLIIEHSGDRELMLNSLKEYVEDNPEGPYHSFGGAYEGTVEIYRQDIDKIISDKPFVMISQSGHGGWANTKALEMAGIIKGQLDPIDFFERDKDGAPNGYLGSSASAFYLMSKLGLIKKEAVLPQADDILDYISSNGITSVFDAGNPQGLEEPLFSTIAELEIQDKLSIRIVGSVMAQRPVHIKGALAALKKYGHMYSSELFNVNTLKVHGDGDFGGFTSGLLEPYTDNPESRGLVSCPDPEQFHSFMLDAVKLGYDIHSHATGDWTNRIILNGFEEIRNAGYKDVRLSMGHTMIVDKQDRPRFKELDITVNTFATNIAVPEPLMTERIGEERHYTSYMLMKSFIDDGVRLTLSADWPTENLNPFLQIYTAMTRSRVGEDESLPPASEKLTLEDAIRAYTVDAAYQVRMEEIIGSIEVGKRADIIVIDQNIFDIMPDKIPETKVLTTMMNGKIMYEKGME
jgi:predicted amidohydrolase YtcJ